MPRPRSSGAGAPVPAPGHAGRRTDLDTVLVIAKSPRPGRVKTRLTPLFTPEEAALLAAAAVRDTLCAAAGTGRRTVVAWDGPHDPLAAGRTARGSPPARRRTRGTARCGVPRRPRPRRGPPDPARRDGHPAAGDPGPPGRLAAARTPCSGCRRTAATGRWGCASYRPGLFDGVPMSTDHTGRDQLDRLRALGLRVRLLPTMRDIDEPQDAARRGRARTGHPVRPDLCAPRRHALPPRDPVGERPRRRDRARLLARRLAAPLLRHRLVDAAVGASTSSSSAGAPVRSSTSAAARGGSSRRWPHAAYRRSASTSPTPPSGRTRARGGSALLRDVFRTLPAEGRWRTLLLADGNIGIGADPVALLQPLPRAAEPAGRGRRRGRPRRDEGRADGGDPARSARPAVGAAAVGPRRLRRPDPVCRAGRSAADGGLERGGPLVRRPAPRCLMEIPPGTGVARPARGHRRLHA